MIAKLSLQRVLLLFSGSSIVALTVTLLLFLAYSGRTTADLDRVIHKESETSFLLHEMWAHGLQTEQALRNIILNPTDQRAAQNYEKSAKAFDTVNVQAMALAGAEAVPILRGIRQKWAAMDQVKTDIRNLAVNGQTKAAIEVLNARETPLWREVKAAVLRLIADQKKICAASFDSHADETALGKGIIIGTSLFFAIVLCLLAWSMAVNPEEWHSRALRLLSRMATIWASTPEAKSSMPFSSTVASTCSLSFFARAA